jgi:hypothetical protein
MTPTYETQQTLAEYYRIQMADPGHLVSRHAKASKLREQVAQIEDDWIDYEESLLDTRSLPTTEREFLAWYIEREKQINRDIAPFIQFLKKQATLEQVAYYICMEELIDGSFDDLVALVQVGMPVEVKMIAAENYWDEMGNGDFERVHTTMFRTSSSYLREHLSRVGMRIETVPLECLMNGNILLMWALRRQYSLRLVGAMGLVEGSAPKRFHATTLAMERLKLPEEIIAYHRAHIGIDSNHSKQWLESVLSHYIAQGQDAVGELARGVVIRYRIAIAYYSFMHRTMSMYGPRADEAA